MTATTPAPSSTQAAGRLTFGGIVASESLKARSLRSVRWLVALALLIPIAIAVITVLSQGTVPARPADRLAAVLGAVSDTNYIPLLLLVSFATVVATSEYERGAASVTFAVVPRRTAIVLAKVVVVAVTSFVVSLVSGTVSFLLASGILGGAPAVTLASPDVARVLAGTALAQAASATIALSVGLMLRSSIATVAATLGFIYVVPALLQAIPVQAVLWFAGTLPGPESTALEVPDISSTPGSLAWSVVAILAWTAATVALASVVVRRRDV